MFCYYKGTNKCSVWKEGSTMRKQIRKQKRIRNRRIVRFTAFTAIAIVVMAFFVTSALGWNTASGASTQQYVLVEVQSGDTLWELARQYGPANTDIRVLIYEICRLNEIDAASLQAGQILTIPVEL